MPPHEKFPPRIGLVVDASVFLNFAFVRRLDPFVSWFKNLGVTLMVVSEVLSVSKRKPVFGPPLDLQAYIDQGLLRLEEMDSSEETIKFFGYQNQEFNGVIFHKGESSCLAVALVKQYGLLCDERVVIEEFKKEKNFDAPAWTSREVVHLARKAGIISQKEASEILAGFDYQ
jgi:predicted nucleic acid-binding protein